MLFPLGYFVAFGFQEPLNCVHHFDEWVPLGGGFWSVRYSSSPKPRDGSKGLT